MGLMTRRSFLVSLAAAAMPGGISPVESVSRSASKVIITATVNLGPDNGSPLGTLFQLRRTNSWEIVGALGVPQFYNHYVRNNPRLLHGHGRRAEQGVFAVETLGTPRNDNPRYHVFVLDGVLIDGTNREFFDEGTGEWVPLSNPWVGTTFAAGEQINFAHWIDAGLYVSTDKGIYYDGTKILNYSGPSYKSSNGTTIYHDGLLYASWDDGVVRVYDWSPGEAVGAPINSYTLISGHFLRAFGILNNTVYAMTSRGTFARYNRVGNNWTQIGAPENTDEFYCLMQYFNEIRIGDYPGGDQWRFQQPSTLQNLAPYPPDEVGVGTFGREIQAMTMYGGDMVVPLFPWGVVHRRHISTGNWYYQRLYGAPAFDTSQGPYTVAFGHGDWRQRIPCAALWQDSCILVGSNTPGNLLAPNYASVPNSAEYGTVWKLTRPHAVSAELTWKSVPTTFALEISAAEGVVIKQDGVTLGSVAGFAPSQFEGSDAISVEFGSGIYGMFSGSVISTSIENVMA
jgi:hypothetical protein